MGRFHRHDDGTVHEHRHDHEHPHSHSPVGELGDHTGYQTGDDRIDVLERIFDENDRAAAANRAAFDAQNVACVNLMSAPGAGKTTLLQRTLGELRDRGVRTGIVEGDIETSIDADRLRGLGAQIALLNTGNGFGGECHLDAPMVARALIDLRLDDLDLLLVENVGNLVCPAEFDVGAHSSAMVYAVTEGEEKPLKYPVMFRAVDLVVVNKVDLLPYLDFDLDLFEANLAAVNPGVRVIRLSARTGAGIGDWLDWVASVGRN
ncbi:hydrogenase nickel incorporation protein HypB [Tsukamurella soli]|uniref:Hydrogenase nickel incorporation protein HypB n=1 Tax=Tsukamurella soli TaxID=644556 RepID=A0ABP8K2K8_9ACTN